MGIGLIAGAVQVLVAATAPSAPAAAAATPGPCLVIGDSIAVKLGPLRPNCTVVARGGITSDEVLAMAPANTGFRTVIVSMGSNDAWANPVTGNLATLRKKYPSASFSWIAPRRDRHGLAVVAFAKQRGDRVVRLADFPSRDTMHPDNYTDVAKQLP